MTSMSPPPDRNAEGARSAIAILEAVATDDWAAGVQLVHSCDAVPTILALASAWQMLAEFAEKDIPGLLDGMRAQLPTVGGAE